MVDGALATFECALCSYKQETKLLTASSIIMERSQRVWRAFQPLAIIQRTLTTSTRQPSYICTNCLHNLRRIKPSSSIRQRLRPQRRQQSSNPADSPGFQSIVDNPPQLIRSNRKHKPLGLLILAAIPITSFFLGCWQVQRLGWKTDLIARFEDRLVRDPLPLPPAIDPDAVGEFDYRRVVAKGRLKHEDEMLIGPRLHDGKDGYLVVTPLDRSSEFPPSTSNPSQSTQNTTILVNRGWIPKDKAPKSARPDSLPTSTVQVQGLLRSPWKKNMFTPSNKPQESKWYFPDVYEMAEHTGSQAIWVEETMQPDLLASYDREARGIPIGRAPEVNLRNNHTQYIFTWFSLSLATSVMLWMVVKKPPSGVRNRVRQNRTW